MTDETALYGTEAEVAHWLVTHGLRARYAALMLASHRWRRWDGTAWQPCPQEEVHQAVRVALEAVRDRHPGADPDALLRLVDVNWRLGPLMRELRRATALQDAQPRVLVDEGMPT